MLIYRVWANRVTLQVLFRYSWLLTVMFYDKMILSKSYFHGVFLCGWKTKSLLENISKNLYTHSPFLKSGWKFWLSYEEKEVQLNSFVLRGEQFVVIVVQLLGNVLFFATLWTTACQSPLSSTISLSLLRFMFTESVMLSNHLILCHPLLLLPSIFPNMRVSSDESALHIWWPKYPLGKL